MTQDALRLIVPALMLGLAGCTSAPTHKAPSRPLKIEQGPPKATAPVVQKPTSSTMTTTPPRTPVVNTQNMNPPVISLTGAPGSGGTIGTPTLPTATPISAAPRESAIPPTPPEIGSINVPTSNESTTEIKLPVLPKGSSNN